MTDIPIWVLREMDARLLHAQLSYLSVQQSCGAFGISRDEYCRRLIEAMPPITWAVSQ